MTTTRAGIEPLIVAKERRRRCAAFRSSAGGSSTQGSASQITCTGGPVFRSQSTASDTVRGNLMSRQHLPHCVHLKCESMPAIPHKGDTGTLYHTVGDRTAP